MTKPYKGVIDDWYIHATAISSGKLGEYVVVGTQNGDYIRTSRIVQWSRHVVETENSIYLLGFPYGQTKDQSP